MRRRHCTHYRPWAVQYPAFAARHGFNTELSACATDVIRTSLLGPLVNPILQPFRTRRDSLRLDGLRCNARSELEVTTTLMFDWPAEKFIQTIVVNSV